MFFCPYSGSQWGPKSGSQFPSKYLLFSFTEVIHTGSNGMREVNDDRIMISGRTRPLNQESFELTLRVIFVGNLTQKHTVGMLNLAKARNISPKKRSFCHNLFNLVSFKHRRRCFEKCLMSQDPFNFHCPYDKSQWGLKSSSQYSLKKTFFLIHRRRLFRFQWQVQKK